MGNLTGSGTTYSAIFTPDNNSLTAAVISLQAGDFSDLSGNDNLAASLMVPVNTDAEAPTVSITSDFVGVLGSDDTAEITINLSEPASSSDPDPNPDQTDSIFSIDDVDVVGGALVAESWQKASDSDTSFTVQVVPDADFLGSLNISIPTGSFTDLSRNPNASGSLSLPVNTDITAPSSEITIVSIADDTGLQSDDFITSDDDGLFMRLALSDELAASDILEYRYYELDSEVKPS